MSRKTTVLIAVGALAAVGAFAAVSAQGHRQHGWGGPMQMGMGGDDGGMGRMGGRFGGSLTKDEFEARTRERFARFDRNNDGFIDAAEIEAQMAEHMGRGMGGKRAGNMTPGSRMLAMFDANRDGKVTKDEFQAAIRKRFAEMDLNNDGKISDDDLPPMMRGRNVLAGGGPGMGGPGMGGPGGHRGIGMGGGFPLFRMLQGADANKDGVITLDEVLAAADARFAALDRNKDSQIDQADFDAVRKEMTDYRVKRFVHHYGADKDGKVSRDQFLEKAREQFARLDVNNDGTISRDERPGGGFMHRMRERMGGRMGHGPMHEGMGPDMGPGMGRMGQNRMGPGGPGGPGPAPGSAPAPAAPPAPATK